MSAATENLRNNQEQADRDGIMVKVSRQAVDETLVEVEQLRAAVERAQWARTRLDDYADRDNAGRVQGGGREWKRKIWAAFADFDAAAATLKCSKG